MASGRESLGPAIQSIVLVLAMLDDLPRLAEISKWLRKEREFAFYWDIDFIPTEEYRSQDAERTIADAIFVLDRTEEVFRS